MLILLTSNKERNATAFWQKKSKDIPVAGHEGP
jgi:hypothetical protein